MREELMRLAGRGAEEGLRVGLKGARYAVKRAERAGLDVSAVKWLFDAEAPRPDAKREPPEAGAPIDGLYEGLVRVDVGPFERFSQLVDLEDAANAIGAAGEIGVERFSNGRATLTLDLTTPTDLISELESHAPFDFTIRRTTANRVVLDVPTGTQENP